MKKRILSISLLALAAFSYWGLQDAKKESKPSTQAVIPEKVEREEEVYDEEKMKLKNADWSLQNASRHQKILQKYKHVLQPSATRAPGDIETFGTLKGGWKNRGPKNMPGAFKFAEMLDGTDTIYGVTHNHYTGEFNSKSYIFKGTIYNPKTGTMGDDFVRLTGHWPNRYRDLIAHKFTGVTRLIAGIENGPVYYSDNDGKDWTMSTGLPSAVKSTIINRQDELVYATDGGAIYVSSNGAESFTLLESQGTGGDGVLYSPRYNVQPDADKVYFAREGVFYELNAGKTSFIYKGSYSGAHGSSAFSIGGDSRKLYVTEGKSYWVSTNGGASWTSKYPKGNWYGDRTGSMSAGMKVAVSPANADHVMGGYAQPVFSTDGLNTDNSTTSGWGNYQNGTSLGISDYQDRIRFNYHPDFQAQHFFYNSSGDLFSAGCTDGGIFISYKVWDNHPTTTAYDNSSYATAHFININTLNTPCALIYRDNLFTGHKNPDHINFSTQDQGSQSIIDGTSGQMLDFYQSIGGDGPPITSADGTWAWQWQREGGEVWAPGEVYDGSGNRRSIAAIRGQIQANSSISYTKNSTVGWIKVNIDKDEPNKRIWLLGRTLEMAVANGSTISKGASINKGGSHQVAAFAQATLTPDEVYFLQKGIAYKSTNRGNSYDAGTSTPFSVTSNTQNLGSGWVNPTNDNWILFAGPSGNGVGAILSKDGGTTWTDVTGDFPSGDDFQVGGMTGTPDGEYVFAGTDVGPFVFVVAEEKWYPMFGGEAAMFNTTAIEYVASANTVRFGTWGSGVWDFAIDDGTPVLTADAVQATNQTCDSLIFSWSTNIDDVAEVKLLKGGSEVETWNVTNALEERFAWLIPDGYTTGSDYTLSITANSTTKTSNSFSISSKMNVLSDGHLSVISFDSEHSAQRAAANTADGDNSTFWHSEWSPNVPDFPHTIVFESDTIAEWVSFSHLPRQDGSSNGRIETYKVYGSTDNTNWTELKSGTLANVGTEQTVALDQTMECKYIKFEMLSEVNGNKYGSMAEFRLSYKVSCGNITSTPEVNTSALQINSILKGRMLNLDIPEEGNYEIRVVSMAGKLLWKQEMELTTGAQAVQLPYKLKSSKLVVVSVYNEKYTQHRSLFMRK